jgi:hypothetical protein
VLEVSDARQDWLNRGRFPPQNLKQMIGIDDAATKVIALAICRHAQECASEEGKRQEISYCTQGAPPLKF